MGNNLKILSSELSHEIINYCLQHHVIPIYLDSTYLEIAAENEDITQIETTLRFISNRQIKVTVWPAAELAQAQYKLLNVLSPNVRQDETSTVNLINQIIDYALQHRASDIHFEPEQQFFRIRLRIDGVLQDYPLSITGNSHQLTTRLKIISDLDIAERRLPQDGQLSVTHKQQTRSLRISTLPTIDGEKIVLRVMESVKPQQTITELGMTKSESRLFIQHLNKPQGLILVTGPTGSGKSATLYSGLSQLIQKNKNICSIEDPVELPIKGVNQSQVNHKINFNFARALRAFLRQDPDVIMVGEIRDKETADIVIEAAQTGHLVMSTLHTNSTAETLVRLQQMKIPAYLLASSLKLIIAQRLIRKLCIHCRTKSTDFYIDPSNAVKNFSLWHATGCQHCLGGYYQRMGIFEILTVTEPIRHALLKNTTASILQNLACQQGMLTLYQRGLQLVEQGVTSLAELNRVIEPQCREIT